VACNQLFPLANCSPWPIVPPGQLFPLALAAKKVTGRE